MTNQEIVEALKKGDAKVYDHLYPKYGGKVVGYIMKNGGTQEDGIDVLHATLLKLPKAIQTYEERSKFDNWFFTIVTNTWFEILRGQKKNDNVPIDTLFGLTDNSDELIEHTIVKERKYEIMERALDKIDKTCRDILKAFHYEKIPSKQLAAENNITDVAMRGRLHDCRNKWKEECRSMLNL